jgi:hypothetical protein
MSLETWKSIADWSTIVFIGLTVVTGSAALILGDRINAKQSSEVEQLKLETAKANKETAQLQVELELEKQRRSPRQLSDDQKKTLAVELRGKVPRVAFVVQRDVESRAFALQLEVIFQDAGAKIMRYDMPAGESMPIRGVLMYRPGGGTSEEVLQTDPVYIALKKADLFGGTAAQPFGSLESGPNGSMLPSDGYVLYVGEKPQ